MNQVLDKFGVYDLVAVLLSGICISTFSLIIDEYFFHFNTEQYIPVDETFFFW